VETGLVERIRRQLRYEKQREGPPEGFPGFPDIPGERYTDPEFLRLEREHVFGKSWLLVGRESDLREPGSFLTTDKPGVPILVVRGRDGALRAFYNTCQHRGAPVVREPCGVARQLRCQYHSWTYDLEGELIGVPDRRDFPRLDLASRRLPELRCEIWDGWVFVNQQTHAPALLDWLGPIPAQFAELAGASLRTVDVKTHSVPCNWKVAADAFMEVYHLRTIHPETVSRLLDHRASAMGLFPNGHTRMVTEKWPEAVARERATAEAMGSERPDIPSAGELVRTTNPAYGIFPNLITPLDAFGFPFILFWPEDVRTTTIDVIWYGPDWGDAERPRFWDLLLPGFDVVMEEDFRNLAPMQRSLESPGLRSIPLSYQERRIYWYHEQIDRMIGPDLVPPGLRVEPLLEPFVERATA
jgi:phenylpropionate dioxygenase-like ring-hydroxylating dioxygenase large terminal subunit